MVINDITGIPVSGAAVSNTARASESSDTSITPFDKILEGETAKTAQTDKAVSAKRVTAVAGGGSESGSPGTVKLKEVFERASEKYDISYDFLVAVAKAESDFDYNCVSSAGAKGIMQLMPDEVKEFGVSDVFNPEQNIMASAKLLAAHLKKFNGDFTLAAAAYNAGSGAVQKYGGVPPYTETQNYVKRIAAFMDEGVNVPDKSAEVADTSLYGSAIHGGSSTVAGSADTSGTTAAQSAGADRTQSADSQARFDKGSEATEQDWDKVLITVGTGDQAVTMTYGAYLKYKELGSLGVG
ncbi:MAG: lytic transglycosylase domain-containing protein [Eubacterium sp.]|nr:lytic transglycosylase domain-containing protein [Eubacterium sp.]